MTMLLFCFIVFITSLYDTFFGEPIEIDTYPPHVLQIETKINVTNEVIDGKDWNGDGFIYQEYQLNEEELESVISDIKKSDRWNKEVLTDELKELLLKDINFADINPQMVKVDNGYYFFKDRHKKASGDLYCFDADIIHSRNSYNCTVAALDVENRVLYYYQLDT